MDLLKAIMALSDLKGSMSNEEYLAVKGSLDKLEMSIGDLAITAERLEYKHPEKLVQLIAIYDEIKADLEGMFK